MRLSLVESDCGRGVRLSGAEVEEGQTIEQEGESSEEDL